VLAESQAFPTVRVVRVLPKSELKETGKQLDDKPVAK
jgi:hypothetical protein